MLSATSRPYIDASVPVLREHGHTITRQFYQNMFAAHPELHNLFNLGNQASGVPATITGRSGICLCSQYRQRRRTGTGAGTDCSQARGGGHCAGALSNCGPAPAGCHSARAGRCRHTRVDGRLGRSLLAAGWRADCRRGAAVPDRWPGAWRPAGIAGGGPRGRQRQCGVVVSANRRWPLARRICPWPVCQRGRAI